MVTNKWPTMTLWSERLQPWQPHSDQCVAKALEYLRLLGIPRRLAFRVPLPMRGVLWRASKVHRSFTVFTDQVPAEEPDRSEMRSASFRVQLPTRR